MRSPASGPVVGCPRARTGAPPREAGVGTGALLHLTGLLRGLRARPLGPPPARCHVELGGQRDLHPTGPPLQRERRRRGDVDRHRAVHPVAPGHHGDPVGRGAASPGRADEDLGTGRFDRTDAEPGARPNVEVHREPGAGVGGGAPHRDAGAGDDRPRPDHADEERAEDHVPQELHPPRAAVVGDQPPQADDAESDGDRRHGPRGPRPEVHGRGAGVASRSWRTSAAACPMLSSPSTVRRRWARQLTATAFTSSGTT